MWILCGVFGTWAIISIFAQVTNRVTDWFKSFDVFGLIPNWKFFAPRPACHDNYLYYRDHSPNGVGLWHRAFDADARNWRDPIWNPLRREEKAISDCISHLLEDAKFVDTNRIQFSTPYLAILSFISSIPNDGPAIARQFLLARQYPGHRPTPVFVSNIHLLPKKI